MKLLDTLYDYKHSDNLAMLCENEQLTYRQLWEQSDLLASYIKQQYGKEKTPLVVYGHKSPLMLVAFIACAKAGRPYIPVDISVPLDRVSAIIDSTQPDLIIATEPFESYEAYPTLELKLNTILSDTTGSISPNDFLKEDDVYYIIFTSGSTGTPKGVQITYGALNHFIEWALTLGHNKKEHTRYINQAPFSFDLSVMDVYMSLASESCLIGLTKDIQGDYKTLFSHLQSSDANTWVSTPSFADLCLADSSFSQSLMPQIKLFLFCGEILTNATAQNLLNRFPAAEIYNTYGPTESTVAVTELPISAHICQQYNPLPVGKPKPGTTIKIMDDDTEVKEGDTGEIIIMGNTVSVGYFKNEAENKKKFFTYECEGEMLPAYRTGDKGYMQNGLLFYCGRMDLQIKLHGYRMEIEDIEKNLMKVTGIDKAVVIPVYKENKVTHLKAYCIYRSSYTSTIEMKKAIKSEMAKLVPAYMIPKIIQFVTELPMTNNGKIDRKAM